MPRSQRKSVALALLAAGTAAVLLSRVADRRSPRPAPHTNEARDGERTRKLRVVVVGAGFGGLDAARPLSQDPAVDLTVLDAHNHHLFQPLLYQVATASLSPADIATPVRSVLPASDHVRVLLATVTGVDPRQKLVLCADGPSVPYDRLVIATGSEPSYFGHAAWAEVAPGLKTLDDAVRLRTSIVGAFERASTAPDAAARTRLMTFVLIGGGPTGVEMAGAVAELARDRAALDYGIDPDRIRIVLVDAGSRVLAEFAPDLSRDAAAVLQAMGVEIRTGTKVTGLEEGIVHLGDEVVEAGTIIWAAGTAATPVARWLGVKPGHGGRVPVDAALHVPTLPEVSVIGDASLAPDAKGRPLPGLAPVAKQQGAYVADTILRALHGQPALPPFRYRDYGILATIGRNKAVAEFGSVHLTGFPAWLTWAGAHILFLISFRSRVAVSLEWAFAYVTHRRSAGLIIRRDRLPGQPARAADPS